ncbi:MAG: tetratricopeptide repeat protein [Candidatus Thioglobus sp.]|nr:tetratricopeptide repeat protein [Candidatus Thioglobus pontius]MBL6985094.1 tetratricopeptide repeat protein [Candidatus Thioglobus sp.]
MKDENKPLIFEVSQNNFEDLVVHNSSHLPVIVEFMGIWSEPCIKTEYALSDLAKEFPGGFIFAKVDIDEQDELKQQFSITNVPTLAVFKNGKEIQREEGELQKEELRVLLKHYGVFRASDELRDQARIKHMEGDTQSAIMLLTQAVSSDPSNTRIALDMVQIFLDINEIEQAQELFDKLPESVKTKDIGLSISSQFNFIRLAQNTSGIDSLKVQMLSAPNDYQVRFDLAVCLFAQHDIEAGMEMLFFIQENEPNFKEGVAREMIGMICNMLANTNPEESGVYRQRLANLMS